MSNRYLRPSHIVVSGDAIWLVDESRPAAAIVEPRAGTRVVTWTEEADEDDSWEDRVVVADGAGVVTQLGSTVTWIRRDGSTRAATVDVTLAAADGAAAWFVDNGAANCELPGVGWAFDPDTHDESGVVVALSHERERQTFETEHPVRDIVLDGDEVVVVFAEPPRLGPSGRLAYVTSTVRVRRDVLFSEGLDGARRIVDPTSLTHLDNHEPVKTGNDRWTWLETSPARVLQAGERAGGLVWWAGNDQGSDKIHRRVSVVAHDAVTGDVTASIDAGEGMVATAAAVGDEFWVAIARERFHFVPDAKGVEVIAFSARGRRTVLEPDSLDISTTNPPLVACPASDKIRRQIDDLRDHLMTMTRLATPSQGRFSRRWLPVFDDVSITEEGDWPETTVAVTFRHRSRPSLLLRRTYRVFDQTGRPIARGDRVGHLEEDMESGYVLPAHLAVDGVLET